MSDNGYKLTFFQLTIAHDASAQHEYSSYEASGKRVFEGGLHSDQQSPCHNTPSPSHLRFMSSPIAQCNDEAAASKDRATMRFPAPRRSIMSSIHCARGAPLPVDDRGRETLGIASSDHETRSDSQAQVRVSCRASHTLAEGRGPN